METYNLVRQGSNRVKKSYQASSFNNAEIYFENLNFDMDDYYIELATETKEYQKNITENQAMRNLYYNEIDLL